MQCITKKILPILKDKQSRNKNILNYVCHKTNENPKRIEQTEIDFLEFLFKLNENLYIFYQIEIFSKEIDFAILTENKELILIELKCSSKKTRIDELEKQINSCQNIISNNKLNNIISEGKTFGFYYDNDNLQMLENDMKFNDFKNYIIKLKSIDNYKLMKQIQKVKKFNPYESKDIMCDINNKKIILSEEQEGIYSTLIQTKEGETKIYNGNAGIGKTIIISHCINYYLKKGKKVLFLSLNEKKLNFCGENYFNYQGPHKNFSEGIKYCIKQNNINVILTDEIQRIYKEEYFKIKDIIKEKRIIFIGLGDQRLNFNESHNQIPREEYIDLNQKYKLNSIRSHQSIEYFVDILCNKEVAKNFIEDRVIINLIESNEIIKEKCDYHININHDRKAAIKELGNEKRNVSIYLECNKEEFNKDVRYSPKRKLITYLTRAIDGVEIFCTNKHVYDLLNECKNIN